MSLPRVGEAELPTPRNGAGLKRWKHKSETSSKSFDKSSKGKNSRSSAEQSGRAGGGVKNMDQIVRNRKLKEKRVKRSTQPSKRKAKGKR